MAAVERRRPRGLGCFLFFFFQAEDGIRDLTVTGVQTCALPICHLFASPRDAAAFLIANGFMLYGAERLRRRAPTPDDWKGDSDARIAKLSWREAEIGRASCRERV